MGDGGHGRSMTAPTFCPGATDRNPRERRPHCSVPPGYPITTVKNCGREHGAVRAPLPTFFPGAIARNRRERRPRRSAHPVPGTDATAGTVLVVYANTFSLGRLGGKKHGAVGAPLPTFCPGAIAKNRRERRPRRSVYPVIQ